MLIRTDFFLCTLLTLQPYSTLYKNPTIYKSVRFTKTKNDFIIINNNKKLFEDSLFNTSLSSTCRELFLETGERLNLGEFKDRKYNHTKKIKLKSYLKKFKYNYYNYFFAPTKNALSIPKSKILNKAALEYLTIFLGF